MITERPRENHGPCSLVVVLAELGQTRGLSQIGDLSQEVLARL